MRGVGAALIGLLSGLWLCFASRVIAVPLYLALVALLVAFVRGSSSRPAMIAFVLFILATLSPVDASFLVVPGPPRLVPYVMGLPDFELSEKAARGEVVLGGCVVTGFEPRWVVVW